MPALFPSRRLLAVPLLLAAAACGRETPSRSPDTGEPAIRVALAPVTDTAIRRPIRATGVLGAKEEVPLGFKVGGVIARISVEEGERVRAGQLLALLEPREIDAEVARAQAAMEQAERDLVRAEALFQDSVIPRERLEEAETGATTARAGLTIARFNRGYAEIRAPQAGVILRRLSEPGQQISNGTAVLVLAGVERGQVLRLGLADRDAARVSVGDPAMVRFDARSGQPESGRVTQVAAAASPGSGAWSVEVTLDHPGPIVSGLIGDAEITPREPSPVRLVPLEAVLEADGDSAVVYSVEADRARRHEVAVAFIAGDRAAIASGLNGVDSVVTAGAAYLADGAGVRLASGTRNPGGTQ
jgi:membrane fusion protein, multidrug efflux system